MKFALLIHQDEAEWSQVSAEAKQRCYDEHVAFMKQVADAGVGVDGSAELTFTDEASVLRPGSMITDGPFAEGREQLGGLYIVDVPTREDAIEWAKKVPLTPGAGDRPTGAIEVRRIL